MAKAANKKKPAGASKLNPTNKEHKKNLMNKAHPSRVSEVGYRIRHLSVEVPVDHTKEDVLAREYWANCVTHVNNYDKLCLDWVDGSKYWELKVIDKGDNWVQVHPVTSEPIDYDSASESENVYEDFEVKYLNPTDRCGVIRKSDGAILTKDHISKASARAWLLEHKSNMIKE